jgi:hypothetical protein
MGEVLISQSHAHRKAGNKKEAKALEQRAREIAGQQPSDSMANAQVHLSELR